MISKKLNITLVNPFLGAAYDVFKQVIGCELKKGKITLKEEPTAEHEVAIIIGISGREHTGIVVYSMQDYTAKKIINNLVPDFQFSNDKKIFTDALGELANIISGNAMSEFTKNGLKLSITTPSVITGNAFELHLLKQTTLSADMISPFGNLEVNVAMKQY